MPEAEAGNRTDDVLVVHEVLTKCHDGRCVDDNDRRPPQHNMSNRPVRAPGAPPPPPPPPPQNRSYNLRGRSQSSIGSYSSSSRSRSVSVTPRRISSPPIQNQSRLSVDDDEGENDMDKTIHPMINGHRRAPTRRQDLRSSVDSNGVRCSFKQELLANAVASRRNISTAPSSRSNGRSTSLPPKRIQQQQQQLDNNSTSSSIEKRKFIVEIGTNNEVRQIFEFSDNGSLPVSSDDTLLDNIRKQCINMSMGKYIVEADQNNIMFSSIEESSDNNKSSSSLPTTRDTSPLSNYIDKTKAEVDIAQQKAVSSQASSSTEPSKKTSRRTGTLNDLTKLPGTYTKLGSITSKNSTSSSITSASISKAEEIMIQLESVTAEALNICDQVLQDKDDIVVIDNNSATKNSLDRSDRSESSSMRRVRFMMDKQQQEGHDHGSSLLSSSSYQPCDSKPTHPLDVESSTLPNLEYVSDLSDSTKSVSFPGDSKQDSNNSQASGSSSKSSSVQRSESFLLNHLDEELDQRGRTTTKSLSSDDPAGSDISRPPPRSRRPPPRSRSLSSSTRRHAKGQNSPDFIMSDPVMNEQKEHKPPSRPRRASSRSSNEKDEYRQSLSRMQRRVKEHINFDPRASASANKDILQEYTVPLKDASPIDKVPAGLTDSLKKNKSSYSTAETCMSSCLSTEYSHLTGSSHNAVAEQLPIVDNLPFMNSELIIFEDCDDESQLSDPTLFKKVLPEDTPKKKKKVPRRSSNRSGKPTKASDDTSSKPKKSREAYKTRRRSSEGDLPSREALGLSGPSPTASSKATKTRAGYRERRRSSEGDLPTKEVLEKAGLGRRNSIEKETSRSYAKKSEASSDTDKSGLDNSSKKATEHRLNMRKMVSQKASRSTRKLKSRYERFKEIITPNP